MNNNGVSSEWSKDINCRNVSVYGFCKNESTCIYKHGDKSNANNYDMKVENLKIEEKSTPNASTKTSAVDAFKQAAILAANKKKSAETATDTTLSASKILLQKALEKKGLTLPDYNKDEKTKTTFNFVKPATPPVSAVTMNGHNPLLSTPTGSAGSVYQQSPLMSQPPPPLFSATSTSSFIPSTPSQTNINFMANTSQNSSMFPSQQIHKNEKSFFLDDSLKLTIQNNSLDLNTFPLNANTPLVIQDYTQLSLMWSDRENKNYYYKCKKLNEDDNKTYLLHRVAKLNSSELPLPRDVNNINKSNKHLKDVTENCNILNLESTFVTASFMDNSLCHIYEYYPLMIQLNEFLGVNPLGTGVFQMKLDDLWFVLFQLLNFVKFLFKNKLHLASGMKDVEDYISFDNFFIILNSDNSFILKYKSLGEILVNKCLKDNSGVIKQNRGFGANVPVANCLNKVGLIWKNLVVSCNSLINNTSINETIRYLRSEEVELDQISKCFEFSRLCNFFNQLQKFNELLVENMSKNFNNETFLKVLIKLNVIMSDYSDKNPAWLPNGNKYPLKLFCDYVFQNHNTKVKSLNYGHIIKNLSKLDSGIYENCVLANSDKSSCLIISYRDLKMLVAVNYNIMLSKRNNQND